MICRRWEVGVEVALAGVVALGSAVLAASPPPNPAVEILLPVPAVRLSPGERYEGVAHVVNEGNTPVEVSLYAAHAVNDAHGAIGLVPTHAWIRISDYRLRLRARQSRPLTFVVQVPRAARSGMYVLGLGGQSHAVRSASRPTAVRVQVAVTYRDMSLLAVMVPGVIQSRLALRGWSQTATPPYPYDYVATRLSNQGNGYTYITATLVLRTGRDGRRQTFRDGSLLLLAHASILVGFYVPWKDIGPHAMATIVVRGQGQAVQSLSGPVRAPKHGT